MNMRTHIDLIEDVQSDVSAHAKANKARFAVMSYVYDKQTYDFQVQYKGRDYYAIAGDTVGLDRIVENHDMLIMIGLKDPRAVGLSGMYIEFTKPIEGKYRRAIAVECMSKMSIESMVQSVNSTAFMPVFEHEFIHFLDSQRTNGKVYSLPYDSKDRNKYFNHDMEFNAFFHNVATDLLSLIRDVKDVPEANQAAFARDLADLYGIEPDFKLTLRMAGAKGRVEKEFMKWLRDDRRKRLVARLYKLHQEVVKLMQG
jgi:hypothetical protein